MNKIILTAAITLASLSAFAKVDEGFATACRKSVDAYLAQVAVAVPNEVVTEFADKRILACSHNDLIGKGGGYEDSATVGCYVVATAKIQAQVKANKTVNYSTKFASEVYFEDVDGLRGSVIDSVNSHNSPISFRLKKKFSTGKSCGGVAICTEEILDTSSDSPTYTLMITYDQVPNISRFSKCTEL